MVTRGVEMIDAERRRQIIKEGWTQEHDDEHQTGEMAMAAACYAVYPRTDIVEKLWPWKLKWWKPSYRLANLVKAGALIAAEIDKVLRDNVPEDNGRSEKVDSSHP